MTNIIEAAKIIGRAKADDDDLFLTGDDDDVKGVTMTGDTIADFIAAQGNPTEREVDAETGREVLCWMASKKTGRKQDLCGRHGRLPRRRGGLNGPPHHSAPMRLRPPSARHHASPTRQSRRAVGAHN